MFVGLSVDDIAVGGHLDKLARVAPGSATHFWITSRRDEETHNWAEARQVRLIRYTSDRDHSELEQFFSDLRQFTPTDKIAPPVVRNVGFASIDEDAMPPEILVRKDVEIIRRVLNAKARSILESNNPEPERQHQFDEFCREYDEAVYRAWFTKTGGELFGYALGNKVARGAFGMVYKATGKDGRNVAVKILKEDLRNSPELFQCFRRGVSSMRILRNHNVSGMVPYIDATEIPAVVVMDWIDGPNLKEAVGAGHLKDWHSRLFVASSLAKIIRRAHSLPERVFHRDLRPPNIMLKGYYHDPDNLEVVVLDFDLSWHLGATEKSMILDSATGYLAPEQLQAIPGVSTRHASVDSFAMGMTLFYIVSGRDPVPAEHAHSNWQSTVMACLTRPSERWASLPTRYGRAILSCTRARQSERWDMGQIDGELERLKLAFENPAEVMSTELLAEEIIARTSYGKDYKWKDDRLCAQVSFPSGLALSLAGDESVGRLLLQIGWTGAGQQHHRHISRWLPDTGRRIQEILAAHSWTVEAGSSWGQAVHLAASMSIHKVRGNITNAVEAINRAGKELRFE